MSPKSRVQSPESRRGAFTLIELMVVVGILAIVMAMGVPSIMRALRKEGMRKAVADIVEVCSNARAQAILRGDTMDLVFRSEDRGFSVQGVSSGGSESEAGGREGRSANMLGAHLPDGIEIAELKINGLDY